MVKILGLDIGGANTKHALIEVQNEKIVLLSSSSDYFPIWKDLSSFPEFLERLKSKLIEEFGSIDQVVFVTTEDRLSQREVTMAVQICYPRIKNIGLRGIRVADTKISYIDGMKGVLQYRGFRIEDLAKYSTYEEVAHLLIYGHLPSRAELEAFDTRLREARMVPPEILDALRGRAKTASSMNVLQGAVPILSDHDPDFVDNSKEAVPQINYRTLLYIKTMTLNKHKSEIHDTPGVNTNKILKNCYLRCNISYQSLNIT